MSLTMRALLCTDQGLYVCRCTLKRCGSFVDNLIKTFIHLFFVKYYLDIEHTFAHCLTRFCYEEL